MADRIGVMQDGRLAQVGTPAEVYERPQQPLRRRVPRRGEHPAGRSCGMTDCCCRNLGVTVRTATSAVPGPALLALRPERLRIGRTEAPNRLTGVVVERSYAGETLTHSVRVAERYRAARDAGAA